MQQPADTDFVGSIAAEGLGIAVEEVGIAAEELGIAVAGEEKSKTGAVQE